MSLQPASTCCSAAPLLHELEQGVAGFKPDMDAVEGWPGESVAGIRGTFATVRERE
jgi:hypothetical protein